MYYHIDRNDLLKLNQGEIFERTSRTPNKALNIFNYALSASSGVEGLLQVLNTFSMNENFPILEEFQNFNPERYDPKDRRFINKYRVELVYEYVRVTKFANQVSRFEGFYLTQELDTWVQHLNAQNGTYLYGFVPIYIEGQEHDATWPELSMESTDFALICSHAENYWKRIVTEMFKSEILCVGSLKVVEKYTLEDQKNN